MSVYASSVLAYIMCACVYAHVGVTVSRALPHIPRPNECRRNLSRRPNRQHEVLLGLGDGVALQFPHPTPLTWGRLQRSSSGRLTGDVVVVGPWPEDGGGGGGGGGDGDRR